MSTRRTAGTALACGAAAALGVLALLAAPAAAQMTLPPGFTSRVYVSGDGFDAASGRGGRGFPSSSTLAFDGSGTLFMARTGRRYTGGEVEDIWPIYRIPAGGAVLSPATERQYLHGPPLPNPQVAAIRGAHEVLVTTFDRDRRVGVLYRLVDGRAEMLAGGTPPPGGDPLLRQPEGAAVDASGRVYVADRAGGRVLRLDAGGRALEPLYFGVTRPRLLALDARGRLYVASDGGAEAPWVRGPGEIWRIAPDGTPGLLVRGPTPSGMALGPAGLLYVADRQAGKVLTVAEDGTVRDFIAFAGGDAPRALAFAPDTPATRRAGIAGALFVVTIARGAWPVNEVVQVSGPFAEAGPRP
jgi:hypothetical protein